MSLNRGIIYVLVASVLWGLSGVFAQYLFHEKAMSPIWLVCVRLLIPGAILLLVAVLKNRGIFEIWRYDTKRILIYSIFGIAAVQLTYFIAVKESNAATATILQYLSPVIIAVFTAVAAKKLPSGRITLAIILALAGTFFLATHGSIKNLSISRSGLLWGIGSAFITAFYVMGSVNIIKRWGGLAVIGWGMLAGGLILSIFVHPWNISGIWDIYTFVAVFYIVIFGSLITFYLYLMGIQGTGGQMGSILSCAEPLSAAVLSILFLGVTFTGMDWFGTLCIIATVMVLTLKRSQRQDNEP